MSKTYPCEECRETFSIACRFRNQQKTHSGEQPYPCTFLKQVACIDTWYKTSFPKNEKVFQYYFVCGLGCPSCIAGQKVHSLIVLPVSGQSDHWPEVLLYTIVYLILYIRYTMY